MFNYNPAQEVLTFINTNNIDKSRAYWNYICTNMRYNSSNKIAEMLNIATTYYNSNTLRANAYHYPVDLAYRALNDPTKLAFCTGASGRATQEAYNRARQNNSNLQQFLNDCGFTNPSRHNTTSKKCIHFIFVSSGFSLIRNFVNATATLEHHEFYETIINTYRKQNLTNIENETQTIVLKNVYETGNDIDEILTIITNKIPDLEEMLTILEFVQAHYSEALITNKASLQLTKQAIEQNDNHYPLATKLRYYLTEFWETELQYKNDLTHEQRETLHNTQTNCLNEAYTLILKSTIAEAPKRFLQNLADRYNYDYINKDKNELESVNNNLSNYYAQIQKLEHQKQVLEHKLAILNTMDTEEIKEFWEAITLYKNIKIESTSDTALILKIQSPLTFYDEESTKTILNNPYCAALNHLKNKCEDEEIDYNIAKAVLFDIFINKKYQIHTYTRFKLSIESTGYSRVLRLERYYNTSQTEIVDNKIYQPHIMAYNCFEQALTRFYAEIAKKNFDVAFGQLVGATQNIDTGDVTVFKHLLVAIVCKYPKLPTIYDPNTKEYISFEDLYQHKQKEIAELEKKLNEPKTTPVMKPITEITEPTDNTTEAIDE